MLVFRGCILGLLLGSWAPCFAGAATFRPVGLEFAALSALSRRRIDDSRSQSANLNGASGATRRVPAPTVFQAFPFRKSLSINRLTLGLTVRFPKSPVGRHAMVAMLQFATLVLTTMFAAAAAVGRQWLFLEAALLMMRPATAQRIPMRTELARGTAQVARAFVAEH